MSSAQQSLWLAAQAADSRAVWTILGDLSAQSGESLSFWTVIGGIDASVREWPSADLDGTRLVRASDRRGDFIVGSVRSDQPGVSHVFSFVPATDGRWNRIRRLAAQSSGGAAPVYLNEADFLAIGDRLGEYGDVSVSRMTARMLEDGSSQTRGWKRASQRPRLSPRDVVEEAREMAIRTMTLEVGDRELRMHLRREAGATFYSGDFSVFVSVVLSALALAASQRQSLLRDRERRIGQPLQEVVIELGSPQFEDQTASKMLLAAIVGQPRVGIAVLHRNPYVHAVVTDYSDGSNFNVVVATASEIRIMPGYRATLPALARLTETIGNRFGAVRITEPDLRVLPSLKELALDS